MDHDKALTAVLDDAATQAREDAEIEAQNRAEDARHPLMHGPGAATKRRLTGFATPQRKFPED